MNAERQAAPSGAPAHSADPSGRLSVAAASAFPTYPPFSNLTSPGHPVHLVGSTPAANASFPHRLPFSTSVASASYAASLSFAAPFLAPGPAQAPGISGQVLGISGQAPVVPGQAPVVPGQAPGAPHSGSRPPAGFGPGGAPLRPGVGPPYLKDGAPRPGLGAEALAEKEGASGAGRRDLGRLAFDSQLEAQRMQPASAAPALLRQGYVSSVSTVPLSPEQIEAAARSAAGDLEAASPLSGVQSRLRPAVAQTFSPSSALPPASRGPAGPAAPGFLDVASSSSHPTAAWSSSSTPALAPSSSTRAPAAAAPPLDLSPVSPLCPAGPSSTPQELLDLLYPAVSAMPWHSASAKSFAASHAAASLSSRRLPTQKIGATAREQSCNASPGSAASPHFQQLRCGLVVTQVDQRDLWRRPREGTLEAQAPDASPNCMREPGAGSESEEGMVSEDRESRQDEGLWAEREGGDPAVCSGQDAEASVGRGHKALGRGEGTLFESRVKCQDFVEETLEQVYLLREFGGIFSVARERPESLTLFGCLGKACQFAPSPSVSAGVSPEDFASVLFAPAPASPLALFSGASAGSLSPALAAEWRRLFASLRLSACTFWLLTVQTEMEIAEANRRFRKTVEVWQLQREVLDVQDRLYKHQEEAPRGASSSVARHAWKVKRRALFHSYAQIAQKYREALSEQQRIFDVTADAFSQVTASQLFDANEILPNFFARTGNSQLTLRNLGFPRCCCTDAAAAVAAAGALRGFRRLPGCTHTCGCRVCVFGLAGRVGPTPEARETTGEGDASEGSSFPAYAYGGDSGAADSLPTSRVSNCKGVETGTGVFDSAFVEAGPGRASLASTAPLAVSADTPGTQEAETARESGAEKTGADPTLGPESLHRSPLPFRDSAGVSRPSSSVDLPGGSSSAFCPEAPKAGELRHAEPVSRPPVESDENAYSDGNARVLPLSAKPLEAGKDAAALAGPRSGSPPEDSVVAAPLTGGQRAHALSGGTHGGSLRADLDDEFEFDDADLEDAHHALHPGARAPAEAAPAATAGVSEGAAGPGGAAEPLGRHAGPRASGSRDLPAGGAGASPGAPGGAQGPNAGTQSVSGVSAFPEDEGPTEGKVLARPVVLREPLWGEVEGTLECDMTRMHRLLHWKKRDTETLAVAAAAAARSAAEKAGSLLISDSGVEEGLAALSSAATAAALAVEEEETALATERTELLKQAEGNLERAVRCLKGPWSPTGNSLGSASSTFDVPLRYQQQSMRFLFLFLSASYLLPSSSSSRGEVSNSPSVSPAVGEPPSVALPWHSRERRSFLSPFVDEKEMRSSQDALLSCVFFDLNDDLLFRLNEEEEDEVSEHGVTLAVSGGASGGPPETPGDSSSAMAAIGAFYDAEGALAGVSRTAALRLRRKAKQEVLKLDKQKRIELVKQGKSALELHAMAAAEQETRSSKARSPLQEFVVTLGEFSLKEKLGSLLQRLNTSFDAFQADRRLHCRGKEQGLRGGIPLIHTKIAFQLQGTHPVAGRRGRLAMLRFHRPDFRAGLVSSRTFFDGSAASSCTREDRRRKAAVQSVEQSPWVILPPEPSAVMNRLREELCRGAPEGEASFPRLEEESSAGSRETGPQREQAAERGPGTTGALRLDGEGSGETIHLANLFYTPQDLSLRDDAPIAVLEYMEQQPLLMHNPGMAIRIVRHFVPHNAPNSELSRADQLVHAERQVKGRLGPFGELQLQQDDAKLTLFGTRLPLARGQGQAVAESPLLKAPVYVHPTAPNAPVKRDSRFHDYRDTDFILVRTRAKDRCKVYLRPLLYPPPEKNSAREGFSFYRSGGSLESLSVLGSPANCGVYTVGQCEPRMEVHAPNSKKHVEDRKLHAKAWALRFAAEKNVTDMKRVKDLVKQRFCPPVVEKEVTQMLKLLSPIAPHRLPRLDDAALRSIIRPELICCLEAAHAALFRLKAIGIMTLTSADGLAGVAQFIEKEERHAQEKVLAAKKRLKEIEMKFRQQAEARLPAAGGKDADLRAQSLEAANAACQRAHAALSSVCTAYAESRIGKRYGHLVRFIEELLLLTPWNLTKECKDVLTNKGSAQFMLSGFGDPSGGRGEGISLIKRLNRERAGLSFLSGASRNFGFSRDGARSLAGAFGPGGIFLGAHLGAAAGGGVAGTGEDLRKLSMQELRRRLVQYGLSESVIRTLPRWDQVALVRQYRDGFGNADFENEEEGKKAKGGLAKTGRLRGEEYEERLTDILQRQKKALEADAPAITDTEDEGEEDAARENAADVDLLEEQKAKKGKKVTKDEERHKAHAKKVGTASPGNLANGDPNHGQDKGVEDALLAALDGEEEEKEADEDELERRELQALRQRQEARAAKPLTAEEQQRADMKVQAVPCLRWIRRFRQQAGEPFATERVVLIYGEKNIRNFIQWRTKRLEDTRARMLASTRSKEALAGKRVCRACGQPGHIASNVNCPLYSGPKRPAAALTPPPPVKKRRKENLQLEEDLLMGLCPEGENESEVNAFGLSQTSGTPGRQRAGGAASSGGRGRSARGAVWEEEDEFGDAASSLVSYSRRRAGTRSAGSSADGHTQFFGGKAGEAGGRKKASRRRGAGGGGGGRGRESLEEEEERTQDEEDEEEERWTPERNRRSAIDELNIALARIVNVVLQQQIFKPFWQRVDERYAPNYYRVIANPMWLQKIASKCKQREYVSGEQFLADVRLVVTNCFLFNPPNSPSAWLRERATNLEETVRQKFEEQRATVAECEAVIMSHGVGITGMAADGVAAHMGYPMM
uniref:Bromodomain-containing protein n=1 Tax=Toxoplasma gondii (strain ATCC 50861 / VEG) TaxID=432359 RepID=A0A0F7UUM8_TOXGV|nr:TPA: bromodomain-containing protein [Toxoplasma gondii VEG]